MRSFPLLWRSRSWAVVCLFSLLSLSVLALAPSAGAQGYPGSGGGSGYPGSGGGGSYPGSYGGPDYSGSTGQITFTASPGPNPPPRNYSFYNDGTYGGEYYATGSIDSNGANISSGTATCSGPITAKFTWNNAGNPNNTPPPCVIIMEHCVASWSGEAADGATATGGCMNPLGGSPVSAVPGPGATWEYTRYSVQNNPLDVFTLSCSPEADGEAAGSGAIWSSATSGGGVKYNAIARVPPLLQGHSTVDANGINNSHPWGPNHPLFFSGTNCSISGTAMAYSPRPGIYPAGGTFVMQASLSIGGTAVKLYYDTSFIGPISPDSATGTNQGSVPLSVFFDSTHFADASTITAQMNVTDSGGLSYMVPLSGPACNNLIAVANQTQSAVDPATGENVAINAMNGAAKGQPSQPNFQPYPGVTVQSGPNNISAVGVTDHHKVVLINDIATSGYTVFFATTHADPGALGDCYSVSQFDAQGNPNPAYDPAAYLHDADIQGTITARTTALSAPYLFAYLYGCNGASDPTTVAADFGFPQSSGDDRAFLGYAADIAVTQENTNFAVQVWHDLMQGLTLDAARTEAASDYHIQPWPNHNSNTTTVIWGDSNMTLHGKVYNWTSGPTWYR